MKLHDLCEPLGTKHPRKRVGRGIAAGQGKTAGYGTKGNGARSGRGGNIYFEGGQLPLVRRLPHNRGFRNHRRVEYAVVNVAALNQFDAGTVVDRSGRKPSPRRNDPRNRSGNRPSNPVGCGFDCARAL